MDKGCYVEMDNLLASGGYGMREIGKKQGERKTAGR